MANTRWDSMRIIQDQLTHVIEHCPDPKRVKAAIERAWQLFHMGPIILPTKGINETQTIFDDFNDSLRKMAKTLDQASRGKNVPEGVGDCLIDLKVYLETEIEVIETIGNVVKDADPNAPATDPDAQAIRELEDKSFRNFNAPVPKIYHPEEEAFTGTLGCGQCFVVVKEFHGMLKKIRCKKIPRWVEPWYSRRRIVGYKKIWYIDYCPAEFIKRIVTFNTGNDIKTVVHKEIIEEPELQEFQYFFPKR